MAPEYDFAERRRRLLQERGELPPDPPDFDTSADVPDPGPERSEEDQQVDEAIDKIDILAAYSKWCGKMKPSPGVRRTEGIMISCPKPDHPDKRPSAWINTDKQTWFCGGCQEGGDKYDIAAFHFRYPVPGYKDGHSFHELRREMAESFGWRFKTVPGGTIIYQEDDSEPSSSANPAEPDKEDNSGPLDEGSSVAVLYADEGEDEDQEVFNYPSIKWRETIPEETFLYEYMEACSNDDSPEEYHFWHGLLALGHAAGRNITLTDKRPVYGNLLVCLLGGTGTGKSSSRYWLDEVIEAVMPFRDSGMDTSGVKIVSLPASGEFLIREFQYEARDPSNPKISLGSKPINGIVDFDEFAGLLARANRQGSTLKTTIMAFADTRRLVSTGSVTHGAYVAHSPFCSLTASTQPRAVRTILARADTGSGFLNRWVFAGGPPKQREVLGGVHSSRVIDLETAKERLKKVYGWAGKEKVITMTDDGLDTLNHFYQDVLYPTQARDDTDLLKRLDLLFKKLILLFCINEKRKTADAKLVGRVERLFKYVINCYAILNDQIGITMGHEINREIKRHVMRHEKQTKRGATVRDLRRYMARKNYPPEAIKKTLETMVALEEIELEKMDHSKTGPKTARYRVVRD